MLEACCSLLQDDNGEYASGTPILGDVLTVSKTRVYNVILMKWLHFTWVGSLLYQYSNYLSQIWDNASENIAAAQPHHLKEQRWSYIFCKILHISLKLLGFFFFFKQPPTWKRQ